MGRLTRRINAEITKGLTYEAIIYKDIEHHETDFNYEALNKLAHYENLEEQGLLIKLDLNQYKRDDLDRCTHRNCNNCDKYRRELQKYKDLEEQGRWIETPETGIGNLSDGYHTFNELYHHRAVLFSVICNAFKSCAWKSKKHSDGTMYDGMFIVGIDTPEGSATYHYDIEPYWNMFDVKELDKAPEWDGHTPDDAISRIAELSKINRLIEQKHGHWKQSDSNFYSNIYFCSNCLVYERVKTVMGKPVFNYCPNCGAKMESEVAE